VFFVSRPLCELNDHAALIVHGRGCVIVRGDGCVRLAQVPDTLVQIDSEWQGFLYFVYEDEIVVVDPNDMEIVAVLPV
jgi:hypothetical protein